MIKSVDNFSLSETFITEFKVSANQEFDHSFQTDSNTLSCEMHADFRITEEGNYFVMLHIHNTNEENDEAHPYIYEVRAFARVNLIPEEPVEEYLESAIAYGLQVLVGLIREQLLTISQRGPWIENSIQLGFFDIRPLIYSAMERWKESNEEG